MPATSCGKACDANASETCGGPSPGQPCVSCGTNAVALTQSSVRAGMSAVDIFTFTCPDACALPKPSPIPPAPPPAPPAPAPPPAPPPPPAMPAHYRPAFHYTPPYRYGDGPGDTSGAVYSERTKTYHVFPLTEFGIEHASSTDLVHCPHRFPVAQSTGIVCLIQRRCVSRDRSRAQA